jgi:lipopolysaccharide/colanic/teichoic acid biosynthesis glycosyltransferase
MRSDLNTEGKAAVKKNIAAFRYADHKVIPLYISEATAGAVTESPSKPSVLDMWSKRALDVVFSLFVIIFGFPFFLLIAALIKLTSEGPVLYIQERIGLDRKPFKLYKFRTMMVHNSDSPHRDFTENFIKGNMRDEMDERSGKPLFKLKSDPRITSIGKFLRRTSLDEIPQFYNVLKGEMTLVGPRPPLTYELPHYKEWHKSRLVVKPGLTGLWQVSGRSTVTFDEMVMLDLYYIDHRSLLLDLKIILRTIPVMLFGSGGY